MYHYLKNVIFTEKIVFESVLRFAFKILSYWFKLMEKTLQFLLSCTKSIKKTFCCYFKVSTRHNKKDKTIKTQKAVVKIILVKL